VFPSVTRRRIADAGAPTDRCDLTTIQVCDAMPTDPMIFGYPEIFDDVSQMGKLGRRFGR